MRFRNFHAAYLEGLRSVYVEPQFVNSPRGAQSRERLNFHFTLTEPTQRVCTLPTRATNIVFNFAEVLWYLSGSDSLEYIAYYAGAMPRYSMDGETLTGTAYGPKIFRFGANGVDQWERVMWLLTEEDPDSKRAFIQIFDAHHEWLGLDNLDVSCTAGLQFLLREGKLYTASFMRANDVYRGMISDVFSFTFLQEFMARQLGVGLGDYHHNVGSAHVYETDYASAERILDASAAAEPQIEDPSENLRFPELPTGDNWSQLREPLRYEARLRENRMRLSPEDLEDSGLHEYWCQIIMLFGVYRGIVSEGVLDTSLYELLPPIYRHLIASKWPPRNQNVQHSRAAVEWR